MSQPTTIAAAQGFERQAITYGANNYPVIIQGFMKCIKFRKPCFRWPALRWGSRVDWRGYVQNLSCVEGEVGGPCRGPGEVPNYPQYFQYINNIFRNSLTDCILGGDHSIFRGNLIDNCGTHGLYVTSFNLIEGNHFNNMLRSCVHNFDNTSPHQGSVIRNNLFTGCQERAITATGGEVGGGDNVMVYNNIAINSGAIA